MESEIQLLCVIFFLKVWFYDHELTPTPDHRYTNTHRENQRITRSRAKESEPHPHTAARRRLTLTANSLWNTLTHQHTNFEATTTSRAVKCVFYLAGKKELHSSSHRFGTHVSVLVLSSITHPLTQTQTLRKRAGANREKELTRRWSTGAPTRIRHTHTHTDTDTNQQKQCNFSVFFSVCLHFSFWF